MGATKRSITVFGDLFYKFCSTFMKLAFSDIVKLGF